MSGHPEYSLVRDELKPRGFESEVKVLLRPVQINGMSTLDQRDVYITVDAQETDHPVYVVVRVDEFRVYSNREVESHVTPEVFLNRDPSRPVPHPASSTCLYFGRKALTNSRSFSSEA